MRPLFYQLADFVPDRLGRGINPANDRRDMLAVFRSDIELLLPGVGQELRIRHGGAEGVTQHREHIGRETWRSQEWATDVRSSIEELGRLPVFRRPREVVHVRHILEGWVRRVAALEQDGDLLVRYPVGALVGDAVEQIADAVDLAALHRQEGGG